MARFQELDGAHGDGKVIVNGKTIMVKRKSTLILGLTYWEGGGEKASSGDGLAKALQRKADKGSKGKPQSSWWGQR